MATRELTIRMYKQGLGDCFLLSFPKGSKRFHMMIDCGAFASKHYGAKEMKEVVSDIRRETDGRLDVVVGTHEHWDHTSGFVDAKDVFDTFAHIGQVWVAWTEEPNNAAAEKLRKEFKKRKKAVAKALTKLPDDKKQKALGLHRKAITELFGFFGGLGAKGGPTRAEQAWKNLLALGPNVYCDPKRSTPMEIDGVPGVRIYVLGPPEDPAFVRKKESSVETYHDGGQAFTMADSFLAAVDDGGDPELRERAYPFEARHRVDSAQARSHEFFQPRYGFDAAGGDAWRRIDHDWLTVAGELALYLDSYTNNTCLAFAIELGDGGDVLLFPGDAQVGNWLSWGGRSWTVKDAKGKSRTVTTDDLLARTVLYKVGHHGSHNATLRAKGLEKMAHAGLVAMIPVHRPTAKDQEWPFPYRPLWTRLKEKARGRVLLADAKDLSEIADAEKQLSPAEWKRFKSATSVEKLYTIHRIAY